MAAPELRVELIADSNSSFYGYFTLDTSVLDGTDILAPDTTPVDITSDVRSADINRGRARDLDEFVAGRATITLNDTTRKYDPTHTSSPLYGQIEPRRQIWVTAVVDGVDYPLFRGYAQRWDYTYLEPNLTVVTVTLADGLSILARQKLAEIASAHDGDLFGARVSRVLDRAEVNFPADLRDIDTGKSTFGPTTLGGNNLAYLQRAATSEGGALFITGGGVLRAKQRNSFGAVQATFSDDGDAAAVRYTEIGTDFSDDLLYNLIELTGTSGNTQTAEDATSQASYQIANLQRSDQMNSSDTEVAGQAEWLLQRFKMPETRFTAFEVAVTSLAVARQAEVLGLELTDRVSGEYTPPGGGSQIVRDCVVDGLAWRITPTGDESVTNSAYIVGTVTVSSAEQLIPFILDDATYGVLDTSRLGY